MDKTNGKNIQQPLSRSIASFSVRQTIFQKPKFVIGGFQRGDLDQGEIGMKTLLF